MCSLPVRSLNFCSLDASTRSVLNVAFQTYAACVDRADIKHYDHNDFPGVVPRTFIGAMMTALFVSPMAFIFQVLNAPKMVVSNCARYVMPA